MKRLAMVALITALCCGVAGCSGSDSDEGSVNTVEQVEIEESETTESGTESSEATEAETGSADASMEAETGSGDAEAETGSENMEAETQEQTEDEETEDVYIGSYYCEETATNLTVAASENEGYDYTFTWGDGVDWESSYDAVLGDDVLTITIPMKSDVVLTVTADENGLTITGDDAYNSEVVQNQRLDGVFEKAE